MSPTDSMESNALLGQIDSVLEKMDSCSCEGVCKSHGPFSDGIRILLQCERANIKERAEAKKQHEYDTRERRKETIAVASIAAGVVGILLRLCGK
jgi:hypothetical protein